MRELVPGHKYMLQNLKGDGETPLQFFQDGSLHEETLHGTYCQEVIRVLIARVKHLDTELQWVGNAEIIEHLRFCLALFEARAVLRKYDKLGVSPEDIPVGFDGHFKPYPKPPAKEGE